MELGFFFTNPEDSERHLDQLEAQARELGLTIVAAESSATDLYFARHVDETPSRTGLKIALGSGWSETQLKNDGYHFHATHALTASEARLLLAWALERQELRRVSPLRHQLGNLVVILLSRIMRMKNSPDAAEDLAALENLHQRLTDLYKEFDALDVPRY